MAANGGSPSDAAWDDIGHVARIAAEHGPDMLVVADPAGVIRFVGRAAERILGIDPRRHPEAHILHFVHPDDGAAVLAAVTQSTERPGYHQPVRVRVRRSDDGWVDCEVNSQTVPGPDGIWSIMSIRGLGDRDVINDRRAALQQLIQVASLECARVRWFEVDEVVEHLLRSMAGILGAREVELAWADNEDEPRAPLTLGAHWSARPDDGWAPSDAAAVGALFETLCPEEQVWGTTICVIDDLGAVPRSVTAKRYLDAGMDSAVELCLSPNHPRALVRLGFQGGPRRWDAHNSDVVMLLTTTVMSTLRRCQAEERLHERARRDPLTGLFNRHELYRSLNTWIAAAREGGRIGVLYCDLDRFKHTNDVFGHGLGDEMLCAVARALEDSVREGDVVARFGGDEFVAVCRDLDSPGQLDAIVRRVEQCVAATRVRDVQARLSIGSAVWAPDLTADDLIGAADDAMYRAKRAHNGAPAEHA